MNDSENIRRIIGPSNCYSLVDAIEPYVKDIRGRNKGKPLVVAFPRDIESLRQLVQYCHYKVIGIVPQGGNTGYSG